MTCLVAYDHYTRNIYTKHSPFLSIFSSNKYSEPFERHSAILRQKCWQNLTRTDARRNCFKTGWEYTVKCFKTLSVNSELLASAGLGYFGLHQWLQPSSWISHRSWYYWHQRLGGLLCKHINPWTHWAQQCIRLPTEAKNVWKGHFLLQKVLGMVPVSGGPRQSRLQKVSKTFNQELLAPMASKTFFTLLGIVCQMQFLLGHVGVLPLHMA